MAQSDGSNLRSKRDNVRLERQKKKNPTNVQRAKQLAQQYSNNYKFDNTVRVNTGGRKWYSGSEPTGRETYAQMYRVADGNQQKFNELEAKYNQERRTIGSPVYNPYADATNYKAIQALTDLGYDLSKGVTRDWLKQNMGILNDKRTTNTGYNAAAPTKTSSNAQDASYWFQSLLNAEERTEGAETELGTLAGEVKYWTDRGYSDKAILQKVRDGFDAKYKTLNQMDDDRLNGSATILNRAIDYSGDDTIYGMIWAARNGGGSGNYFTDSVKYTLGQGNSYVYNAKSEAARDPSDYESYDPYSGGSTMHDLNMRTGSTRYDAAWLDAHRDMLQSDDGRKDFMAIQTAIETTDKAKSELEALDAWVQKKIEYGSSADEIEAGLRAQLEKPEYSTLEKMEYYRKSGSYIDLADSVDFTLPKYIQKVRSAVDARDSEAEQAQADREAQDAQKRGLFERVGTFFTGNIGAADDVARASTAGTSADEMAKQYMREQFGVELTGRLTDAERAAFEDAMGKATRAKMPGATDAEIADANTAAGVLMDVMSGVAADDKRVRRADDAQNAQVDAGNAQERPAYENSIAYRSVVGGQPEAREGMQEMQPDNVAYIQGADAAAQEKPGNASMNTPEAQSYMQMLRGGEWDAAAYNWALNNSTNRAGLEAELVRGIQDVIAGRVRAEDAGLAGSWYNTFGGMVADRRTMGTLAEYDSRSAYGTRIRDAILANQEAKDSGAISKDDYVRNLISLSSAAGVVRGMTGGGDGDVLSGVSVHRTTDEEAEDVFEQYPVIARNVDEVRMKCDEANAQTQAENDAILRNAQSETAAAVRRIHAGEGTQKDYMRMGVALQGDANSVGANDALYAQQKRDIADALNMDALRGKVTFSTGSAETDSNMDPEALYNTGIQAYIQGVSGIADAALESDMLVAGACGMTLEEYYAAFPEWARTSEQRVAEAQAEYDGVWSEFGRTIRGLAQANDKLYGDAEAEAGAQNDAEKDGLGAYDVVGLATAKFSAGLDAGIAKTLDFWIYKGMSDEDSVLKLRNQYGNDAKAYRDDLSAYIESLPEGSEERAQLQAQLDTTDDPFTIGRSVGQLRSEQRARGAEFNLAAIQGAVNQYGTKAQRLAVEMISSIQSSITLMTETMAMGGGLAASIIAAIPEGGEAAYDLAEETGDAQTARLAGMLTTILNGVTEQYMLDSYMPESVGGKLTQKVERAKAILARNNIFSLAKNNPGKLAKIGEAFLSKIMVGADNAVAEGVQEVVQSLGGSLITGAAELGAGVRTDVISLEELAEAGKAGLMGMVTSPFLSGVGAMADAISPRGAQQYGPAEALMEAAQARVDASYEGAIINDAIEAQATRQAVYEAADELAAIEQSAEYAQAQQAQQDAQAAESALRDAENENASAQQELAEAQAAIAEMDDARKNADVFTEEMGGNIVAAAQRMQEARTRAQEAAQRLSEAMQRENEARQRAEQAQAVVQEMYNRSMNSAMERARRAVIDRFFAGDSEAARAASENYLEKCAALNAARERLRDAQELLDMYAADSARGEITQAEFGAIIEECVDIEAEVDAAYSEMEAAYMQSPEGLIDRTRANEVEAAARRAQEAQAAAEAAPDNARAGMVAEQAKAELEAVTALQEMQDARAEISRDLNSADAGVRKSAIERWKGMQQKAQDAVARADALKNAPVNAAQERLRAAIDQMRGYDSYDLLEADSANHDSAIAAANELQAAMDAIDAVDFARAFEDSLSQMSAEDVQSVKRVIQAMQDVKPAEQIGWTDWSGNAKRGGEETTAEKNPIEILDGLTRSLGTGYNPGGSMLDAEGRRVSGSVAAFYDTISNAITTRTDYAGDLRTSLHEFGHALQNSLTGMRATQEMIDALPQDVQRAYGVDELDAEACAEFVTAYMYDRDMAVEIAGEEYVRAFEEMLRGNPKAAKAIRDARTQIELWNNASVETKVDAMIRDAKDPKRGEIGNSLQRAVRSVETKVFDLTAPASMVSPEFRKRALYMLHSANRADVSLNMYLIDPDGRRIGDSLAQRLYDAGVTEKDMQEVARFGLMRHALDRAREGKPVFNESDIPIADIRDYVARISKERPEIVAGADAFVSFWNDYVDAWYVGTGMVSPDVIAQMRRTYPNYFPTYRVVEGKTPGFAIRRLSGKGSSLEVVDPIVKFVEMVQQMTAKVELNRLRQKFDLEFREGGLGQIAERVEEKAYRMNLDASAAREAARAIEEQYNGDGELISDLYNELMLLENQTGYVDREDVVSGVDEQGVPFHYRIKDAAGKDFLNLLKGTSAKDAGTVMRAARKFKNTFTMLTTSANPLFLLKNLMRDFQSTVNTGTHSLTYVDGAVRWMKAFSEVVGESDRFREWKAMGGGEHTRYDTGWEKNELGKTSKQLARALTRGGYDRKGNFKLRRGELEAIVQTMSFQDFNNAIEATSRYVEYAYGKHDLTTAEGRREAFMASQNVTTNFGTRGASKAVQGLTQVVPFMNATLQGLNKDAHIVAGLFSSDAQTRANSARIVGKTLMNIGLTAALQYAILRMFAGDEDDEDYALLNQEMRAGNLIVPIPESIMRGLQDGIGFDRRFVRLPISQGPLAQGIYAVALDAIANVADYSPLELDLTRAATSILKDAAPDGSIFQAFIDMKNNTTWYGSPIETESMQKYSVRNRTRDDIPSFVQPIANFFGTSPAKMDYLMTQYSGFIGTLVMPLASRGRYSGEMSVGDSLANLAREVLSKYTLNPASNNDLSANYSSAKQAIVQIINDGKTSKQMGDIAYSADAQAAYDAAVALKAQFDDLDDEINAQWAEYNDVRASGLSDGEKSARMYDIRRNGIIPLQQEAMMLYDAYRMEFIDADPIGLELLARLRNSDKPTM